jgi:hypothetical protein
MPQASAATAHIVVGGPPFINVTPGYVRGLPAEPELARLTARASKRLRQAGRRRDTTRLITVH